MGFLTDSSSRGHTLTLEGGAAQSLTDGRHDGQSVALPAAAGNSRAVAVPSSTDFNFGSASFTLEISAKFNSAQTNSCLLSRWSGGTGASWAFWFEGSKLGFRFYSSATYYDVFFNWVPTVGQWYDFAMDRDASNVFRLYINSGAAVASVTHAREITGTTVALKLGTVAGFEGSYTLNGNLDRVRITKGVARFAGNFVPGSGAFPTTVANDPHFNSVVLLAQFNTATQEAVAPGAPTNLVAVAGNTSARVSFTAPTSDGGAAITGYKVTASSGQTATGTGMLLVVTGLLNGVPVSFTVVAINRAGTSLESLTSNTVTPTAGGSTPPPTGGGTTPVGSTYTMPTPSNAPMPLDTVDAAFMAWLAAPDAIRCLLVEVQVSVGGVETTRYLSTAGYTTKGGETPANIAYLPLVAGGVKFTETLSLDGSGFSYGDVELNNNDGALDSWLDDVWVNRSIKMYSGDVRWPRSDFRLVFNGVVADIDSKSRTRLNIKLRDMLQRLNTPVIETKLGGTTQSKDRLLPTVFGEVHNMEPLLEDPALHTYRVHSRAINRIIEVRDNGAPVIVTADTLVGKFTLSGNPAGRITASVQGDMYPTWNLTIASIIKTLVTHFGKESTRLALSDIDTTNFDWFDAAYPQPVGIATKDRENVLEACQRLAKSMGAQLTASRTGLLQLMRLQFPGYGTPVEIGPRDMLAQNISISGRSTVEASVKLAYCKNWTLQQGLETGILEEHKNRFGTEWDTKTVRYSAIASAYRIDAEATQRETMLLRLREAEPEAWRLLDIVSVPRMTYRFEGLAHLLTLARGQAVNLTHHRFGLNAGKPGVVVSLTPDWIAGRVTVEVMV